MGKSSDPYHEGELAMQRAAGEQAAAHQNAALISSAVMASARPFLREQHMLVVAQDAPLLALYEPSGTSLTDVAGDSPDPASWELLGCGATALDVLSGGGRAMGIWK